MKKSPHVLLVVLALLLAAVPPALATGEIVVKGGGWGHGIGMSQHGAQAMALSGSSAEQIIQHFYTGAGLGTVGNQVQLWADPLWIGVAPSSTSQRFSAVGGPVTLCLGEDCSLTAAPGETWRLVAIGGGQCEFVQDVQGVQGPAVDNQSEEAAGDDIPDNEDEDAEEADDGSVGVDPDVEEAPLDDTEALTPTGDEDGPESGDLDSNQAFAAEQVGPCEGRLEWQNQPNTRVTFPDIDRTYARGAVAFKPVPNNSSRFHLLVEIGLEEYLYGLAEVPSSWHTQALRAQAIAGRTYAMYKAYVHRFLETGSENHNVNRRNQCFCHLLATTGDQVYTGWAAEAGAWVAAVDSTAAIVATHSSEPSVALQAYYFSSSGGRTENSEDMGWNHRAYLRSVPDPGATVWTQAQERSFTKAQFAAALGFTTVSSAQIVTKFQSGSPSSVVVTGTHNGEAKTESFTGNALKTKLGLRSHYVTEIQGISADDLPILVGDFNNDGRSDVAVFTSNAEWWVGISTGTSFQFSKWATFEVETGWTHHLVGDFNGDDRDDIASYQPSTGKWTVSSSTGSGFDSATWATWSANSGWSHHLVGDFNGDNRDDIASYRPATGNWTVNRSTGSSFSPSTWAVWSANRGWTAHLVGNFTGGNQRDDVVSYRPATGNWTVNRSTGTSFSPSTWALFPIE